MNVAYVNVKIIMWIMIVLFAGDFVMQTISYSFYKGDRKLEQVTFQPEKIQVADDLIGYGYALEQESDHVILCFGGSMYVAYNTVGMYGGYYDCPFLSVDYYGTQGNSGRMNLQTMQKSAEALYDYAVQRYPGKAVIVMGHSYGCGMTAYLASVRDCNHLILLSGYRTSADMYNRILPFYWGPLQVFIKNNIRVDRYAGKTTCPVTVIGSDADTTLPTELQKKLAGCYADAELKIFDFPVKSPRRQTSHPPNGIRPLQNHGFFRPIPKQYTPFYLLFRQKGQTPPFDAADGRITQSNWMLRSSP